MLSADFEGWLLVFVDVAFFPPVEETGRGMTGASLTIRSMPRAETACCIEVVSTGAALERTMADARVARTAKLEEGPIMTTDVRQGRSRALCLSEKQRG